MKIDIDAESLTDIVRDYLIDSYWVAVEVGGYEDKWARALRKTIHYFSTPTEWQDFKKLEESHE